MNFLTTVTGSYPRKDVQKDTLRKSSVSDQEALDMIKWAVKEQADLGLDIITDGEGYRENMYWFYQLRLDGVDAENKKYKHFSTGGSMDKVDLKLDAVEAITQILAPNLGSSLGEAFAAVDNVFGYAKASATAAKAALKSTTASNMRSHSESALTQAELATTEKNTLDTNMPLAPLLSRLDNSIRDEAQIVYARHLDADTKSDAATAAIKAATEALKFAAQYLDGTLTTSVSQLKTALNSASVAKNTAVTAADNAFDALTAARGNLAGLLSTEFVKQAEYEALKAAAAIAGARLDTPLETLFGASTNLGPLDRSRSINQEVVDASADVVNAQSAATEARNLANANPTNLLLGTEAALAEQLLANAKAAQQFVSQLLGLFEDSRDKAQADADVAKSAVDAASASVTAARNDIKAAEVTAETALANSITAADNFSTAQTALATANAQAAIGKAAAQAQIDVAIDFALSDAKAAAILAEAAAADAIKATEMAKIASEGMTFNLEAAVLAKTLAQAAFDSANSAKIAANEAAARAASAAAIGDRLEHVVTKSEVAADYASAAVIALNGVTASLSLAEAYRARSESFQVANGGKSAASLGDADSIVRPSAEKDGPLLEAIKNAVTAANTANGRVDASFSTARNSENGIGNDRTLAENDAVRSLNKTAAQVASEATKAVAQVSIAVSAASKAASERAKAIAAEADNDGQAASAAANAAEYASKLATDAFDAARIAKDKAQSFANAAATAADGLGVEAARVAERVYKSAADAFASFTAAENAKKNANADAVDARVSSNLQNAEDQASELAQEAKATAATAASQAAIAAQAAADQAATDKAAADAAAIARAEGFALTAEQKAATANALSVEAAAAAKNVNITLATAKTNSAQQAADEAVSAANAAIDAASGAGAAALTLSLRASSASSAAQSSAGSASASLTIAQNQNIV